MLPSGIIRLIFFGLLGLCLALGRAPAEDPPARKDVLGELRPGMSPEEVRKRLGPPARVARQILHQRILEQWLYDRPWSVRITFDHPRGQPPVLRSVHRRGGGVG
jgi:hypothetical protein